MKDGDIIVNGYSLYDSEGNLLFGEPVELSFEQIVDMANYNDYMLGFTKEYIRNDR